VLVKLSEGRFLKNDHHHYQDKDDMRHLKRAEKAQITANRAQKMTTITFSPEINYILYGL
jgi:N-acetylglucosamine-6-phosphate deacetylase